MDDANNLPAKTDEAPIKPWEQEQKLILDFITKLESHLCVEISPTFLLNWLTKNGFSYFDLNNLDLVWTMKRNNSTQVMMDNS